MSSRPYSFEQFGVPPSTRLPLPYNQTDRPQTPMSLIQQSTPDQYKKSLADNLAGFLTTNDAQKNTNPISSDLLPKDVNYYYIESDKITMRVEAVFKNEKDEIDAMLDDYLKQILALFESKKSELFSVLDNDQKNFLHFYHRFRQTVQQFLDNSVAKLDRSMRADEAYQQSLLDEHTSPLQRHIMKLDMESRMSEGRLKVIKEIQDDYEKSSINEVKKVIEQMYVDAPGDGGERRRTSVNRRALSQNLDAFVLSLSKELKAVRYTEVDPPRPSSKIEIPHFIQNPGPQRIMSPALWEKLNPDKTQLINNVNEPSKRLNLPTFGNFSAMRPGNRPQSCEPLGSSIMNLNLEKQLAQEREKKVTWGLPTITEEKKSDNMKSSLGLNSGNSQTNSTDMSLIKQSNINISINNVPVNPGSYINIYNAQNNTQKEHTSVYTQMGIRALQKPAAPFDGVSDVKAFRPLSGNFRPLNNFQNQRQTKELETTPIVAPALLSVFKTNILFKAPAMAKRFKSTLLYNDYNSKINCFDTDPKSNLITLGSSDGQLLIRKLDTKGMTLADEKSVQLGAPVTIVAQLKPGLVLAVTDSNNQNLFTVDTQTATIVTTFKTYKERMKLVVYFDSSNFLTVTMDDKLLLYSTDKPVPKKSFKIPTPKLVDICMPTSKMIITGSEFGDIRIIKFLAQTETLQIEGSMKVENKIISLEVVYNNDKMLFVTSQNGGQDIVYIISTEQKKVLRVIQNKTSPGECISYVTVTLYRKVADAYLLAIGENQIKFWDIDDKAQSHDLESEKGESFHLKSELPVKNKLVRFYGNNEQNQIVAVGLCTMGLMSFTLV